MIIAGIIFMTICVIAIAANTYAWINHHSLSKAYQQTLQHLNFDAMQYGLNQHDLQLSNTLCLSSELALFSRAVKEDIVKLTTVSDASSVSQFLLELSKCIHPDTTVTDQFDLISYENAVAINKHPEIAVKLLCNILLQQRESKISLKKLCTQAVSKYIDNLKSLEKCSISRRIFKSDVPELLWRAVQCNKGLR